jgi:hypothetical protein
MYINGCMSVIYVQCVKYDRLEGNEVQDLLESFKAYFIGCKLVCSGVWSNEQVIYLNTFSYPIGGRLKCEKGSTTNAKTYIIINNFKN